MPVNKELFLGFFDRDSSVNWEIIRLVKNLLNIVNLYRAVKM